MTAVAATLAKRALVARLDTLTGLTVASGRAAMAVDGLPLPVATVLPETDGADDGRLRAPVQVRQRVMVIEIFVDATAEDFDEVLDGWLFAVLKVLATPIEPDSGMGGGVTWESTAESAAFTITPDARMATVQIPVTLTYVNRYF